VLSHAANVTSRTKKIDRLPFHSGEAAPIATSPCSSIFLNHGNIPPLQCGRGSHWLIIITDMECGLARR